MTYIHVLHTEWSDGWGGQEVRIINEMLALRQRGVRVSMACRAHSRIGQKAQSLGIDTYFLPFRGNLDLTSLRRLLQIIKQHQVNIVNTHSGKDTWVGGLAAKCAGIKFIRTRHLSNLINSSRLNFINQLADFIMTTGESVRQNMITRNRIKPNKIQSIATGVDTTIFNPERYDRVQLRQQLGIAADEIAIGILAVLRSFKRHDNFVAAAEIILQHNHKVKYFIAGDGPTREETEALVRNKGLQDKIRFLGHLENPAEFLAALDIFNLTSDRFEGVPQSLIQALCMQLPTVATNIGSIADLQHEQNFIMIEANNIALNAKKIQLLIDDSALRHTMRKHPQAFVKQHFSKNSMADKIMQVYQSLLAA